MTNLPAPLPALPDVDQIQLHPAAGNLANTYAESHRAQLVRLAKVLAVQDRANEVQSGHLEVAHLSLRRDPPRTHTREAALIAGGALSGAFLQGFIESLAEGKTWRIVIYVLMGLLGVGLVFWALRKE